MPMYNTYPRVVFNYAFIFHSQLHAVVGSVMNRDSCQSVCCDFVVDILPVGFASLPVWLLVFFFKKIYYGLIHVPRLFSHFRFLRSILFTSCGPCCGLADRRRCADVGVASFLPGDRLAQLTKLGRCPRWESRRCDGGRNSGSISACAAVRSACLRNTYSAVAVPVADWGVL